MHVRIGVTYNPREIGSSLADGTDPESVKGSLEQAVADGGGIFWMTPIGRVVRSHQRRQAAGDEQPRTASDVDASAS